MKRNPKHVRIESDGLFSTVYSFRSARSHRRRKMFILRFAGDPVITHDFVTRIYGPGWSYIVYLQREVEKANAPQRNVR